MVFLGFINQYKLWSIIIVENNARSQVSGYVMNFIGIWRLKWNRLLILLWIINTFNKFICKRRISSKFYRSWLSLMFVLLLRIFQFERFIDMSQWWIIFQLTLWTSWSYLFFHKVNHVILNTIQMYFMSTW